MSFFAAGTPLLGKVAGVLGVAQQAANLYSTARAASGPRPSNQGVAPSSPPHAAIQAATGPQGTASRLREEISIEQERGRQQRANMVLQSKLAIETERELWRIRSGGHAGATPPGSCPALLLPRGH